MLGRAICVQKLDENTVQIFNEDMSDSTSNNNSNDNFNNSSTLKRDNAIPFSKDYQFDHIFSPESTQEDVFAVSE